MDLGLQLRRVRESHHISQKELARKSGLDVSSIGKMERGLSDPAFSSLEKIASAYGLSVGHLLMYGSEEHFKLDVDAAIDALLTLKYNMVKVELTIKPL